MPRARPRTDAPLAARAAVDPAPQVRLAALAVLDPTRCSRGSAAGDDSPRVAQRARWSRSRGAAAATPIEAELLERLAAAPPGSAERVAGGIGVVARALIPRQDSRGMRARLVLLILAAGGVAGAGEHAGRSCASKQPRAARSFVPAGTFAMGVEDDEIDAAIQDCKSAFEPPNAEAQPSFTRRRTESHVLRDRYEEELQQMRARKVTLGAFAIDRDEVTRRRLSRVRRRRRLRARSADRRRRALHPRRAGRSSTSRGTRPRRSAAGAAAGCRPRPSGSAPRAAIDDRAVAVGRRAIARPTSTTASRARPRCASSIAPVGRSRCTSSATPTTCDGTALIAPPGSYPWGEGPYGTRDQAGNVAEWTADALGGDRASYAINETRSAIDEPAVDQPASRRRAAPSRASCAAARGGSPRSCRARERARSVVNMLYEPDRRFSHIGFRCARSRLAPIELTSSRRARRAGRPAIGGVDAAAGHVLAGVRGLSADERVADSRRDLAAVALALLAARAWRSATATTIQRFTT